MPLGAARLNSIAKAADAGAADVARTAITLTIDSNTETNNTQAQFGPTSAYFDGSSDMIKAAVYDQYDFQSNFTIEFWFYTGSSGTQNLVAKSNSNYSITCQTSSGNVILYLSSSSAGWNIMSGSTIGAYSTNTWHHVAITWDGTTYRTFLDGTIGATATNSNALYNHDEDLTWGGSPGSTSWFNGYLDEMRVSSTARYTAAFSTPTEPFTNDSDTELLIHADGTDGNQDFQDDIGKGRSPHGVEALGSGKTDSAQYKFGSTSYTASNVAGNRLQIPDHNDFDFGTSGTFTIEAWIRSDGSWKGDSFIYSSDATGGIFFGNRSSTEFGYGRNAVAWDYQITHSAATNTWHHLAMVRDGQQVKMFLNGTQLGTTQTETVDYGLNGGNLNIGAQGTNYAWDGWIDELRVSSVARYSGNFTAPTAAFENDADTILLLHMDGTDEASVFYDDNAHYSD